MKKLSKIFAVVLVLAMALSMMPFGAAAAEEKSVELTVTTMGLENQKYTSTSATDEDANDVELTAPVVVGGVSFDFIQIGNYGNGLQMRDKDGKTSSLWNVTAIPGKITKIELTIASTKSAYDNPDCMILTFGDAAKGATYSTKLSTVEGTKNYTITPTGDFSFFYLEWDLSYSSYWDSIKVYYEETTTGGETGGETGGNNTPDNTGDNTAIVAMTTAMVMSVAALAVLVIGKKRMF